MKKPIKKKPFTLYPWLALGFFLLVFLHSLSSHPNNFFALVMNNIWAVIYVTAVNFILFEYTVPFLFRKRKFIIYNILFGILLFCIYMFTYSCGSYLWRSLGIVLHIYTPLGKFVSLDHLLEDQMAYSMGSVFFFGVIRHIYNYIKLKQSTQQLRIEKQEAELNYLKSQTNPHFLFNTLNNIYALSKDKSDLAPESILRLSKILRFMLYESVGEFVPVEQELKILSDYMALEELRYDDSLRINFNHDVENMKQALPPLLLMPLVENAFKHGASETRNRPFVDIHLSIRNRQLKFTVKNSVESFSEKPHITENIGLTNLRRQLELLYKDYDLSVRKEEGAFIAVLKINLASHV